MKGLLELITAACCVRYCTPRNTCYFPWNTVNNSASNPVNSLGEHEGVHQTEHDAFKATVLHTTSSPRRTEEALGQAFQSSSTPPSSCFISVLSFCISFYLWCPPVSQSGRQRRLLAGLESTPPPTLKRRGNYINMTLLTLTEGEKKCYCDENMDWDKVQTKIYLQNSHFLITISSCHFSNSVSAWINSMVVNYVHIFIAQMKRKEANDCTYVIKFLCRKYLNVAISITSTSTACFS